MVELHFLFHPSSLIFMETACGRKVWPDNCDELPLWVESRLTTFLLADYEEIVCPECEARVQRRLMGKESRHGG